MNLGENRNVDKVMKLLEKHFFIIGENSEQFYECLVGLSDLRDNSLISFYRQGQFIQCG